MKSEVAKFFSESELKLLESFASNEAQIEAVRKLVLACVYFNGTLHQGINAEPMRNFALNLVAERTVEGGYRKTNEQIGADLKACYEAISTIQEAFEELKKFKPEEQPVLSPLNEAR